MTSSTVSGLFGSVDSSKLDSNINDLFAKSSGPLKKALIKKASKDFVALVKPVSAEEVATAQQEEANNSEDSEKDDEEVTKPQKKKRKVQKDNNEDLEQHYFEKLLKDDDETSNKDEEKDNSDSDNDDDQPSTKTPKQATKVDLKEDELEKAERTIFVGNVPSTVITSKIMYKDFKKLFSTSLITKKDETSDDEEKKDKTNDDLFKIESIRFRSISFNEALPRKVAFVQQKLHESRDSINAYIVYKNNSSIKNIIKKLNAHVFHNRHLRVDSITHPSPQENKRSVFVGNLDFEEDEESLWNHFSSCGDIEYVRIVRDSNTNLGKGFAYVQFQDLKSVNKALLLNNKNMKKKDGKKGRALRISRCKNMNKSSHSNTSQMKFASKLTDNQKTKVGRAKKVLGKADKATIGNSITIEGMRASKTDKAASHLKRKKQRSKTGRVTKRSKAFKQAQKKEDKK